MSDRVEPKFIVPADLFEQYSEIFKKLSNRNRFNLISEELKGKQDERD